MVLWAAGCTLGPDYRRPAPPANAAYTEERVRLGNQRLKPGSDVPADWWRLFRSPKLQALITRALARSPDLEAAQAALTAARETLAAQESALLPALDAAGSVKRQKVSGALFGNPNFKGSVFTVYNGSLNVSYTFDVFGGIRRQLEAKDAEAEYQRFVLEGARLTLVSNLIATAIEEASLRKRQEITESIAFDQQQQLDILRDQQKLGGIADAAVLAQDADLSSTRAGLPPLQKQLDQARHRLAVLAGLPPGSHLAEQFRMEDLQLPEDLPLSVPAKLVAQRPDIRAQEALAHAASAEIGVATTKLFPDFTLTASVGTVATRAGDLFMPGSGIWNTGLNLLQPVFHGGQAIHGRRAAIANFAEADARYRSIVLQALQNVADVLKALEADGTELAARRNAADAAGASLKLVQTQYDAGATSFLALLDARRVDAQSRLALAQIEANRQTDTATLFQALGGGWWNRPDNTDHPSTKEPSP
ncbi:MAG: efflux transporter outer membrane subunit [Methylococcaceae bacterium]|nr:efflux transporter outer membrane subunit [Methylococcaceae bacterium]